jgi:hypothetical protein
MALGRRCSLGCETWPDQMLYQTCLICEEKTRRVSNVTPLPVEDAMAIYLHRRFEKFYELYCAERGQSVDGPLPPDLTPG